MDSSYNNSFGNSQMSGVVGANGAPMQSTPISSGQGDIILAPSTPRSGSKRWLVVVVVVFFLVAVVTGIAALVVGKGESAAEDISTNQGVYTLMQESYTDVTNIQAMFIRLRDGNYPAQGMFSENAYEMVNEMGERMTAFYQNVMRIDSGKISVEQARENIEKLKDYLNQAIPIYTNTVALYNQYYASVATGETDAATVTVPDIFAKYTDVEEFTSVYLYEIMGDLIAELKDYEKVE